MRILYLDNDLSVMEAFILRLTRVYKSDHKVVPVTDLISFDEILYNGREQFDGIVMNLEIDYPIDIPLDAYEDWLSKIGISSPTFLMGSIPILGWEYYDKVMRKREQTKNRLGTVLFKTYCLDFLVATFGNNCYAPATILDSSSLVSNYDYILVDYLRKLENKCYTG